MTGVRNCATSLPESGAGQQVKHYEGQQAVGGGGVTVCQEGAEPKALNPRFDLRCHSPTGFAWGYGGSGPAQLALALAADALGDDERAQKVYQDLKFKVVARLPEGRWTLSEAQVRAAIERIEQDRGHRNR